MLRNLEVDINRMNDLNRSTEISKERKFRKSKKTNLMEIIKKNKYKTVPLSDKEKEEIDAFSKYASVNDLTQKFYKMGIIIAFVYFEAFNKDIMSIFDSTSDHEYYNILSSDKKKKNIKKLNDTLNINLEEQYSQWKSLKVGYYLRNRIVHNNGKIDQKFINKVNNLNDLNMEDMSEIKNLAVDYKQAFESLVLLIDIFFEFILEKIGLRVCCHCKIPFKDKSNNMDFAPICQECHNKSRGKV